VKDSKPDLAEFLRDRRNSRTIPHRLRSAGYVVIWNERDKRDGQWKVAGARVTIYAKAELPLTEKMAAATALQEEANGWAVS
jgi:hypothetical protein